ncbi:uncharacterized protein LOC130929104 isoform X2 [Corythoichthys intestinalis]|uniref:uncharacterized protein LOC130929104 isoform X2 n=1 Tax=Corythoichthys intestinalis TaxID=161448 RepID=UPI0025A4E37C|nr:uncharacterized protein LOC130929104 isoform X2 [Corythoichthys intestinalis]
MDAGITAGAEEFRWRSLKVVLYRLEDVSRAHRPKHQESASSKEEKKSPSINEEGRSSKVLLLSSSSDEAEINYERTIKEEQSAGANSTLISSDCHCPNPTLTEFCREDCKHNSESRTANPSFSTEASTIYTGHQSLRGVTERTIKEEQNAGANSTLNSSDCHCPNPTLTEFCRKDCKHNSEARTANPSFSTEASTMYTGHQSLRGVTGMPVMTGAVFKRIGKQWSKSSMLTRLPIILVAILLLLTGLCWFGLLGLSILEFRTSVSDIPMPTAHEALASEWTTKNRAAAEDSKEEATAASESARLASMENSLAKLWERVEANGRHAERMQGKLIRKLFELKQGCEKNRLWQNSLEATAASESACLASMENNLAELWERVEANGRHAEWMQGRIKQISSQTLIFKICKEVEKMKIFPNAENGRKWSDDKCFQISEPEFAAEISKSSRARKPICYIDSDSD